MAISSMAALPARSPRPFMVPWTVWAPALRLAMVLATAMPKSLWQWTPTGMFRLFIRFVKKVYARSGDRMPTVSQGVTRSAPQVWAVWKILSR